MRISDLGGDGITGGYCKIFEGIILNEKDIKKNLALRMVDGIYDTEEVSFMVGEPIRQEEDGFGATFVGDIEVFDGTRKSGTTLSGRNLMSIFLSTTVTIVWLWLM